MGTQFSWDNESIPEGILVFDMDTGANQDFTWTDLASNLCAAVLTGNNKVGMGTNNSRVIGKVISLSPVLDAAGLSTQVAVQVKGAVRIAYVTTTPVLGMGVLSNGAGAVKISPAVASPGAGGLASHGTVLDVDASTTTVLVLLPN
jgi:hypothetical protein